MLPDIFCPKCGLLVLDRPECTCGWRRPSRGLGSRLWQVELPHRLHRAPCYLVPAGSVLVIPTEDGHIFALERESGRLAWEHALPEGWGTHGLATDGTCLFIAPEDVRPLPAAGKTLLALDAASGEERWRLDLPAHSLSIPAYANGALYFSDAQGLIHAVSAEDGRPLWEHAHPNWGPAAPVAGQGWIAAGGQGRILAAYNAANGRELWRFAAPGMVVSPLAATGHMVFLRCWDNILYALDGASGAVRWSIPPERGQGPTTPPTTDGASVYIGTRTLPRPAPAAGEGEGRYALLSLRVEDGQERWRFPTASHIQTPPAAGGDIVLFGSRAGEAYAVETGAGRSLWEMALERQLVAGPATDERRAYFASRDGTVWALLRQAETPVLAPELYLRQENPLGAAVAYALRGQYAQAAALYESMGRRSEAAQLYDAGERPSEAAHLYEDLDKLDRARALYQRAGDTLGMARITARLGDSLGAAGLYEQAGELAEAAHLYEEGGDRGHAAELYQHLGDVDKAVRLRQSMGEDELAIEILVQEGRVREAAQMLQEKGRLERAANLYRQAGELVQAVTLFERLERWEQVAELALETKDYRREGEARMRLHQPERAAAPLLQAAKQLASERGVPDEEVAGLYEQVARLYSDVLYEEDKAARCRREVRRYRSLPEVLVQGGSEKPLREKAYGTLELIAKNTGFGVARNIRVDLAGPFDVSGEHEIPALREKGEKVLTIRIRPHEGHFGSEVPLTVTVTYQDAHGGDYTLQQEIGVHVEKDAWLVPMGTPVAFNIQGDFVGPGAQKKEEIGDRVEIHRQGVSVRAGEEEIQIQRPGPPVRRCPRCNVPIKEEGYTFCPECGSPIVPAYSRPEEPTPPPMRRPTPSELYRERLQRMLIEGRTEESESELSHLRFRIPPDQAQAIEREVQAALPQVLLERCRDLEQAGDIEAAAEHYRRLLAEHVEGVAAAEVQAALERWLAQARKWEDCGGRAEGREWYRLVLKVQPDHPEARAGLDRLGG